MAESIRVVVCDECDRALFVNGHPRNFCGHSNRGTLTEYAPVDPHREELRQAALTLREALIQSNLTSKTRAEQGRIAQEALNATWEVLGISR